MKSAFLAGTIVLTSTVALAAVEGEFGNYDAMGLVRGETKITACSISERIDGKTYCFDNNAAKEAFLEDPDGNIEKAEEAFSNL